jgi:hypothetical protein
MLDCAVPAGTHLFLRPTRHFRAGLPIVSSLRDWRGGAMQLGFATWALLRVDRRSNPGLGAARRGGTTPAAQQIH